MQCRREKRPRHAPRCAHLSLQPPVGSRNAPAPINTRLREESNAIKSKPDVKRFAAGGMVHPLSPSNGLVGGLVDEDQPHVGQEQEPDPDIVVCLGKMKINKDVGIARRGVGRKWQRRLGGRGVKVNRIRSATVGDKKRPLLTRQALEGE